MLTVPLSALGLDVPTMTFINNSTYVIRPITDHLPMIQNTAWGAIATLNILHPGSRMAGPAQIGGVMNLPVNGKNQMELMADYIFKIFQQKVGMLVLQEVPAPGSVNFIYLTDKLKKLVGSSKLIDVDALANQWLKTGLHPFGTTVLSNPDVFAISGTPKPILSDRAALYNVVATSSKTQIPVANIHGDFTKQNNTKQYLATFDGFCLGDLNITYTAVSLTTDSLILQSIKRPIIQVESLHYLINTVDGIQDTFSKKMNPAFIPDVTGITLPTAAIIIPAQLFNPVVIKIPATTAIQVLTNFKTHLTANGGQNLIQGECITGIQLTTPDTKNNTAHLTISNQKVYESYQQFSSLLAPASSLRVDSVPSLNLEKKPVIKISVANQDFERGNKGAEELINSQPQKKQEPVANFFPQVMQFFKTPSLARNILIVSALVLATLAIVAVVIVASLGTGGAFALAAATAAGFGALASSGLAFGIVGGLSLFYFLALKALDIFWGQDKGEKKFSTNSAPTQDTEENYIDSNKILKKGLSESLESAQKFTKTNEKVKSNESNPVSVPQKKMNHQKSQTNNPRSNTTGNPDKSGEDVNQRRKLTP